MSLPVIPLTKRTWETKHYPKPIEYQAFNIGLQSILLQVSDEDTTSADRIEALRQVVSGCVVNLSPEEVDALPIFVIEKLFLKIRSISVSEQVSLNFKCNHKKDGDEEPCGCPIKLSINLEDIDYKEYEGHTNKLQDNGYYFILQYPNLKNAAKIPEQAKPTDIVRLLLKQICNEDGEVWEFGEYSDAEQTAFVAGLSLELQRKVMQDFFLKQPHIHYEEMVKCPKCGKEHKLTFSNLNQVFM